MVFLLLLVYSTNSVVDSNSCPIVRPYFSGVLNFSVITHFFKNEDSVNPSECKVKYRRTSRPYTGCNSSNAEEEGKMTTPFLTCDPNKINENLGIIKSRKCR